MEGAGQVIVKAHVEGDGHICAVSARRVEKNPNELIVPVVVIGNVETQPRRPSCGDDERLVQEVENVPFAIPATVAVV